MPYRLAMASNWQGRIALFARAAFWAAFAFALYMALSPRPPELGVTVGDKGQHILAFATLTILACAGYPRAELLRIGERMALLGALIELIQSIPAIGRECSFFDWLADMAAVITVLLIVWIVRQWSPPMDEASASA